MKNLLPFQSLPITQQQLESAYHWLFQQRKRYPADADIWIFRRDWEKNNEKLLEIVCSGEYVFSPLRRIYKQDSQVINLWSSQDALVLKLLTCLLSTELNLSPSCMHVKGHGGLKQCVADIQNNLKDYSFVCKTDVKSFYESIDQYLLIEQIHQQIENKIIRRYLYQVIHRTVEFGGNYQEILHGISRGCSLSPIPGALYLKALDDAFSKQTNLYYVRYMDDILIMTKTRWQNRRAIKQIIQHFNQLKVSQHPDKTFIGKIEKGFDFLGYHFSRKSLRLADVTVKRHLKNINQLYEQQHTKVDMAFMLGEYVMRWIRWVQSGLNEINLHRIYCNTVNNSKVGIDQFSTQSVSCLIV